MPHHDASAMWIILFFLKKKKKKVALKIEKFCYIVIVCVIFDYVFSEFCLKNTIIFSHKRFLLFFAVLFFH